MSTVEMIPWQVWKPCLVVLSIRAANVLKAAKELVEAAGLLRDDRALVASAMRWACYQAPPSGGACARRRITRAASRAPS